LNSLANVQSSTGLAIRHQLVIEWFSAHRRGE
jgi:hypothetical protein